MKTLFWHRKNVRNARNESPIYCRITINKVRGKDFSTGIFCEVGNFDSKRQEIRSADPQFLDNLKLARIKHKINSFYLELENRDIYITPDILQDFVIGKRKLDFSLIQAIQEFIDHRAKLVEIKEIKSATLTRTESNCNNILQFMAHAKQSHIPLEAVRPKFANQFYEWIQQSKNVDRSHAARNVQTLKAIIKLAVLNEHIKHNSLAGVTFKHSQKKKIVYLSPEELSKLERYRFASKRLQQVADLFMIQCYTGFGYKDLAEFNLEKHIETDIYKNSWILKPRAKNEEDSLIPLFQETKAKIDKYSEKEIFDIKVLKLPVISNQKFNSYLKEVGEILGFKTVLKTHVGRKTFGTIALNNGYSLEAVSKMMGHKSVKTTQEYYAVILNQRIIRESQMLLETKQRKAM